MKKTLIILFCLIVSFSLSAETISNSGFGLCFTITENTYTYDGYTSSSSERTRSLTLNEEGSFFSGDSNSGWNLGINALFPISSEINGYSAPTDFFAVLWAPKIGYSMKTKLSDTLTMVSSVGYQLMFRFDSEMIEGLSVTEFLMIHGIYGVDSFSYKASETTFFNFGISLFVPIFGTRRIGISGYGSETIRYTFSGVMINPYVGFRIKR